MMEESPYSAVVMDHFMNPRNVGDLPDADGVGCVGSPVCGDVMKMSIKVQGGRIVDIRFKTFGCCAAIASSSVATELIKGKTIDEALAVTNEEVVEALGGLPEAKVHCSVLAEQALRRALDDYLTKSTGKGLDSEMVDREFPEARLPTGGEPPPSAATQ
jgi:nitrogen fixation NifU-like protein